MPNKKICILVIFFVSLLAISAVNAAEDNATDIVTIKDMAECEWFNKALAIKRKVEGR